MDVVYEFIKDLIQQLAMGDAVTLCSVHRSKGLEFHRVFLLNYATDFFPDHAMKIPWMAIQERNMAYVAITRAERELLFINF